MFHSAASTSANLYNPGSNGSKAAPSPYSPLGVLLISKDESAERVLFMYPFRQERFADKSDGADEEEDGEEGGKSQCRDDQHQKVHDGTDMDGTQAFGLPIKMLVPLLQTKAAGNDHGVPFEIKVDNIRFTGFPWSIESCGSLCLAVVFILPGMADAHIVDAFQRLSKKIAIAVNTEQQRCNYLREQICLMQPAHDEFETLSEEQRRGHSPYEAILVKSGLAKHLRDIFEDVCEYGMVDVFVDDCIEVGFCVEPKALCHAGLAPRSSAQVEAIMTHIRPYHGLLFLEDSVPSPDSNPFVLRFLNEYEPSRSIEELALLSGLPLSQVLQIVRHYLLWARAIVIYPICTSNVYANSEKLPVAYRALETAFAEQFPDCQLAELLEAFSPPCSLGSFLQDTAIYFGQPSMHMSMLVFLLRNQLLVQLHTYFYLFPPASNSELFKVEQGNDDAGGMANGHEGRRQQQQQLSPRIHTCVNACKELMNAQLKAHLLAVCARAIHSVGIPESEVFWMVSTFLTFIPHLNGRNHIEDIIYRTNVDRSTVMRVLDTFSDFVCPFICQDLLVEED